MKLALLQLASPPEEPVRARIDRVGERLRKLRGAELIVLPELWAPGYFAFDSYAGLAEPADGALSAFGAEMARELGAHLHLGSVLERDEHGRLYNTALLFGPDGTRLHSYRKTHVFGYQSREAQLLTPGDAVSVTETGFARIAATTCYDLRFPALWERLTELGAELVVVPAAWPAARLEHWRLFTAARAVEGQFLVLACNAAGTQQGGVRLAGHSRIVGPDGTLLAEAGAEESELHAEFEPSAIAGYRKEFPVLADRRPIAAD
ncbi:carbon-nitrogen family hydrolase [Sciscionella sediminilitoris]|uniref:carbon-nitrogen family hydrolase n=1 Tax=Sciscionella sediminilitoris TaxID=1445613 RepID=UPI0004DF25C2|nr:carbon-nitrogen family hydrolase [Sciscionella sp. SE31]